MLMSLVSGHDGYGHGSCPAAIGCATRCGLRAQTLDMVFPADCEDLFISVLCSTATACKRLQHLAMTDAHWGSGHYMGADVRTCGLAENVHAG